MNIDKRKALILLSVVVVVAVIGGIALNAYSTANACPVFNGGKMQGWLGWNGFGFAGWANGNETAGIPMLPRGGMRGRGCCEFIEVSEEFKENVINIAKNDIDVQNLLDEGYNITGIKPIIKTLVDGNGAVVAKATNAIIILEKNTSSRAVITVDMENTKVTEIVILTKTVIQK